MLIIQTRHRTAEPLHQEKADSLFTASTFFAVVKARETIPYLSYSAVVVTSLGMNSAMPAPIRLVMSAITCVHGRKSDMEIYKEAIIRQRTTE